VRLERADRRRLALASALTAVALPAVWLVNRDDEQAPSGRPNVAAVGLAAEDAPPSTSATGGETPTETTEADPMGDVDPLFVDEQPTAPDGKDAAVAVGDAEHDLLATADATYSRSVAPGEGCPFNGVSAGTRVMVLNPANGRSIECVTGPSDGDELVLHPDQFVLLAGLDTAPVPVEIRQ
jgi:hypothetical protein